jgi:hypothetical protein
LAGLSDDELIEALLDPLLDTSEIKTDFGRLQGQALIGPANLPDCGL